MVLEDGKLGEEISIHAPLAGRDRWAKNLNSAEGNSIHSPLSGRDRRA